MSTRRSFLKQTMGAGLVLGLSGSVFSAAEQMKAKKPNFVFILIDDLGWADVACYGNTLHETPNVDRLAKEGMRFTQAYTACAVCSPTRASIQTGKYPVRMGITDWIPGERRENQLLKEKFTQKQMPLEEVTIAEALKEGGYQTAILGKWHLGDNETYGPKAQGYDINISKESIGFAGKGYFSESDKKGKKASLKGEYLTDRLGDEAVKLLEGYSKSRQPFFMMMAFHTVHTPIQPKPELEKKYARKIKETGEKRWDNPAYAAMVQSMDENVGKILDAIKRFELEQDTVVIFTSDNGGLLNHDITSNYPLSLGKGLYHEGGIRVASIIRAPGITKAGYVNDCPYISMDYYPTLLELAGLPLKPEQHKDGLSILPLLKGENCLPRDTFYWHYPHYHGSGETPSSAIRSGDYKFIRHYEDNRKELYNVKDDISEENNLAGKMPEKTAQLEQKLDAWLKEMRAYIPVKRIQG